MKADEYRRWDRFELTYSIWDVNPKLLPKKEQVRFVGLAFQLWQDTTSFVFRRARDRSEADIEIRWVHQPGGDIGWANPPPGPGGQEPEDGNVFLNLAFDWTFASRDDGEPPIDFLTLLAHEIGHSIGLGHYCMFGRGLMSSPYAGSVREVRPHEVNCLRQLYGQSHEPDGCCVFFREAAALTDC